MSRGKRFESARRLSQISVDKPNSHSNTALQHYVGHPLTLVSSLRRGAVYHAALTGKLASRTYVTIGPCNSAILSFTSTSISPAGGFYNKLVCVRNDLTSRMA
jgi:hypothetical protein